MGRGLAAAKEVRKMGVIRPCSRLMAAYRMNDPLFFLFAPKFEEDIRTGLILVG